MRFLFSFLSCIFVSLAAILIGKAELSDFFSQQFIIFSTVTFCITGIIWIPMCKFLGSNKPIASILYSIFSGFLGWFLLAYCMQFAISDSFGSLLEFITGVKISLDTAIFISVQWLLIGLTWVFWSKSSYNKFKNVNASKAGSDAAKTRRPF